MEHPQGMRWATWCALFLYPLNAIFDVGMAAIAWRMGTASMQMAAVALAALFVLHVSVALGLRAGALLAWRANFLVIALTYVGFAFSRPADAGYTFVALLTGAGVYVWPSVIYWRRRRALFHPESPERARMPTQWRAAPAVAWLVIIAATVATLVAGYWPRLPAASAVAAQSAAALPPGFVLDPPAKPGAAPTDDLASHAAAWYRAYPFLDAGSPQANAQAIQAVITRRDQLIQAGMPITQALDQAVTDIAPNYAR